MIGNVSMPHVCSTRLNPNKVNGIGISNILTPTTSATIRLVIKTDVKITYNNCGGLKVYGGSMGLYTFPFVLGRSDDDLVAPRICFASSFRRGFTGNVTMVGRQVEAQNFLRCNDLPKPFATLSAQYPNTETESNATHSKHIKKILMGNFVILCNS